MRSTVIAYDDNGVELEGFVAYPQEGKGPLVLLCHAWRGRDDFICDKVMQIAKLGYVGFALDMYGKGVLGRSKEENADLKRPFIQDRYLLQRRVCKGCDVASQLSYVDPQKIAVVGFGFGGMCALDLARSGLDLKGVVSVYGHFDPPPIELVKTIQAKILVLHGYRDPVSSQDEFRRFEKEMDAAQVDWQAHLFGSAMHAFATPGANDPNAGIRYDPIAAVRAWKYTEQFLIEVLT